MSFYLLSLRYDVVTLNNEDHSSENEDQSCYEV